jgi:hypothetical protein
VAVHDRGQVTPLAAHLEIGDVGDPDLIGAADHDLVGPAPDAGQEPGQAWTLAIDPGRTGTDAVLAHQPFHPAPAHDLAMLTQDGVNSRTAISPAAVGVC